MSTYGFLMQRERMTTERLTSMRSLFRSESFAATLHRDRFATNIPAVDARRGADPVFMQNASSTGKRQTK